MPSLGLHLIIIFVASLFATIGVRMNQTTKCNIMKINRGYIFSFLFVAIFLASRTYVGRDWDNYYRIFCSVYQQEFEFGKSRELGFLLLMRFINSMGFEFHSFISITSILTTVLFYTSFRKNYVLLPIAIFFFFVGQEYSMVINTIRQGIAVFCFLNALTYVEDETRSFFKFIIFILIGALFHYSILVFIPFYWVVKVTFKPVVLYGICALLFGFCHFFLMDIYGDFLQAIPKYNSYIGDDYVFANNSTFGLGAILLLTLRVVPLFFYQYVVKMFPQSRKYFILYAMGLSIYYSFYKFLLITRFTFYLQFCELFVFSFLMIYMWHNKNSIFKLFSIGYYSLSLFNFVYLFKDFLEDQLVRNNFSIMFMDFYFTINK